MTATATRFKAPWVFGNRTTRHLGVEIPDDGKLLTVTEAIKQGGLDWMVDLRNPISNDQDQIEAADWRQVVRVDDVLREDGSFGREYRTLGMVKGRYTILNNREAFKFFDRATLEGAAVIKGVGHLDHGRVVWAIAQLPDSVEILPGDPIHQHLILLTAHDGSHAVKVMFNAYRPRTNTVLSIKHGAKLRTEVRVRHTKSVEDRMADIHNILAAETSYFDQWRAAIMGQANKPGFSHQIATQDQVNAVAAALFPDHKVTDEDGKVTFTASTKAKNARAAILERIDEQRRLAGASYLQAGQEAPNGTTRLDIFLGVSEYIDKDRTVKNEGNNWVASTFGTGATMRQKAFDLIASLK